MSKINAFVRKPTIREELHAERIRAAKHKTGKLLAWALFWLVLFFLLHLLT